MATDGDGSAADLLGGGSGGGGDDAAAAAAAAAGGGGGEAAKWLEGFSADADGEGSSNRDWLTAKGFPDPDGVVKAYRSLEGEYTKLKSSGAGLTVPGADAKPEEVAAYHKAIGVPEKPDDYEIKAPVGEDGKPIALNEPLIARMREAALKGGVPKAAFEAQVSDFIQAQLDEAHAERTRQDGLAQKWLKQQGPNADAHVAAVTQAMRQLGLSGADGQALRNALGADRALGLLAKIGVGMGEDVLTDGDAQRFGITGAEAQKEIDAILADPEKVKAMANAKPGSPEKLRWDRLNAASAAGKVAQQQKL